MPARAAAVRPAKLALVNATRQRRPAFSNVSSAQARVTLGGG
jgi:hypothetical protein